MIAVWLKIMNRKEGVDFVLKHLDFWLNAFSNKEKYNIVIYNENIDNLQDKYNQYKIVSKNDVKSYNEGCATITKLVAETFWLDEKWRGAGFALSIPYWYFDAEYVWNIDADDLILDCGDKINHFIDKVENTLIENKNPILSSDIYYSTPNDSFSFGIAFAHRKQFSEIIKRSLNLRTYQPGWFRNLDFQLCQYFRSIEPKISPIAFTTKYEFVHGGENGLKSYYDEDKKICVCNLYNTRIQYGEKKPKTLLIE